MIAARIRHIEQRMADACVRAGRRPEDVRLVAVTKTQSPAIVNELLQAGVSDIGENRVQEYLQKKDALLPHRLHMIGHLQRNKVRSLIGGVTLIHSVDSISLAEEIHRRSDAAGLVTDILLEVNSSGEESKYGLRPDGVDAVAEATMDMTGVRLRGLMTVAEFVPDPERVRPSFVLLRTLRDGLATRFPDAGITELSMGMTNDFEVAIEEGATLVRVGSAIFGPRE